MKTQNAPTLPIGDSTKSQVEDHIVVIGYPGVADIEGPARREDRSCRPSVTDGAISALKHATTGEQILQISAPITHGNSGGPAIDQHGNVVGLATFGNEGEVQGFNFLVASATLLDFVKDAKVELEAERHDQAVAARPRALLGRRVHRRDQATSRRSRRCSRSTPRRTRS